MAVCQYFLRGSCKFGDSCRNEHPVGRSSGFGNSSWSNPSSSATATTTNATSNIPPFSIDSIKVDITPGADKPLWPLSSYGPGKFEPILIGGLDESSEELRVKAVLALQAGNLNQYLSYESEKIAAADREYTNVSTNVAQAFDQASKQSPKTVSPISTTPNAFGATTSAFGGTTTSTAFGKPAFGQPTFGQSSFGQTSTPVTTSAFGQPAPVVSAFGQPPQPTSAFGQPASSSSILKPASGAFSSYAGTGTSAFGPGGSGANAGTGGGFSAFATQPSAFGASGTSAAPQPATSVFGQPSFGTSAQPVSAFGNLAPAASAFGPAQPTSIAPVTAFGVPINSSTGSAFGPSNIGNVFSQPSAFVSTPASNPFMQQQQQQPSAFAPTQSSFSTQIFPVNNSFSQPSSAYVGTNPPPAVAGPPDFVNAKSTYQSGKSPYDSQLPPDYVQKIPKRALEAFTSKTFTWGEVPDWIPPLETR